MYGSGLRHIVLEVVLRCTRDTRHGRDVDNCSGVAFTGGRRKERKEGCRREEVARYMRISVEESSATRSSGAYPVTLVR